MNSRASIEQLYLFQSLALKDYSFQTSNKARAHLGETVIEEQVCSKAGHESDDVSLNFCLRPSAKDQGIT